MVEGWCTNTITDLETTVVDEPLGPDGKRLRKNGKPVLWTEYLEDSSGRRMGWSDIEEESVYVPAFYWKEIKKYFLETCRKLNTCAQDMGKWQTKLNRIESKVKQ